MHIVSKKAANPWHHTSIRVLEGYSWTDLSRRCLGVHVPGGVGVQLQEELTSLVHTLQLRPIRMLAQYRERANVAVCGTSDFSTVPLPSPSSSSKAAWSATARARCCADSSCANNSSHWRKCRVQICGTWPHLTTGSTGLTHLSDTDGLLCLGLGLWLGCRFLLSDLVAEKSGEPLKSAQCATVMPMPCRIKSSKLIVSWRNSRHAFFMACCSREDTGRSSSRSSRAGMLSIGRRPSLPTALCMNASR